MYYLLMPTAELRTAFIRHMQQHGVLVVFHYLPLHRSEMGRRLGGSTAECPVTEDISARIVRLPFYNSLTVEDQQRVVETARRFRCA